MKDNNLFRKEALQELASPEQLDQLIQVVTPPAWIVACTIYLLLFCLVLWSIFGSIPTEAEGYGILLEGGSNIYSVASLEGPSSVERILVRSGDRVKAGQPLALLSRPDITDNIQVSQQYLADLKEKYKKLLRESQEAIEARQNQMFTDQESLKRAMENAKVRAKNLQELLTIQEHVSKKGIEAQQNTSQTIQGYYGVQNEMENLSNQVIQLQGAQNDFVSRWREQLRALDEKINDESNKLQRLRAQLNLSINISAPVSGVVTHISVTNGSIVNAGTAVITIASEGNGLDALVYLPTQLGKQLKVGMLAQVTPTTIERAEFGSIYGKVISVSPFPVTSEEMLVTLQNQELVKKFTQKEVPIEVRIRLENNPNTFSGLKWSSSGGPHQTITPGTLATARITVRKQAPITLFVPALKKLAGVE